MNSLDAVQGFISQYQVLFVSLGVPLLTILISWSVAVQTNRTSRKLADKERALGVQLKLAEFRQAWIDSLREDIACYAAVTFHTESDPIPAANLREIVTLGARIRMRLNTSDPDYEAFIAALSYSLPTTGEQREQAKTGATAVSIGQKILKREWERLKADLVEIESMRN